MADGVGAKASSVEGAEAHVPNQAARDDSSTSDNGREKRNEGREFIAGAVPILGDTGVAGISKDNAGPATSESREYPVESEKVTSVEESTKTSATNENGDTKDVEAGNGDSKDVEDEEANMVFPSGVPLALLTFGLCMAT